MSTMIFLAHASEDKPQVRDIYAQLRGRGLRPWLDEEDLVPGQNWQVEIQKAIRASDVFVACLSERSVNKSGYVQKEFRAALSRYAEMPPNAVYLIPLRLTDCAIPDLQLPQLGVSLRDIEWLDYWRSNGFKRLLRAIDEAKGSSTRVTRNGAPLTNRASGPRCVEHEAVL